MTENNEYTQSTDTERELRDHAVSALRTTHHAWYGQDFEGWSTEQIRTVERIFRKVSVPLGEASSIVKSWLETHGESLEDEEDLKELFSDLEEPLGIEVTIEEKIDVKISATVYASRKVWEGKKRFVEGVIENLNIGDITGNDVTGFAIDDVEED